MKLLSLFVFVVHLASIIEASVIINGNEKSNFTKTAAKSLARRKINVKILSEQSEKDNKSYLNRYKKENYLNQPNSVTKNNFTTWSFTTSDNSNNDTTVLKQKEIPNNIQPSLAGNYYTYQVEDRNHTFGPTVRPPSARPTRVNVIFLSTAATPPTGQVENAIIKPIIKLPEPTYVSSSQQPQPTPFSPGIYQPKDDDEMEILKKYFRFNCTLVPKDVDDRVSVFESDLKELTTKKPTKKDKKPTAKPLKELHQQPGTQKPPLKRPQFPAIDSLSITEESDDEATDEESDESEDLNELLDSEEESYEENSESEGVAKHGHHFSEYDDSIPIPGVDKVTNLFETAYDFVESAVTSSEVVPIEEKKKKHHKKKKHKKKHKKKKKKHKKHKKKTVKCKEGDHYHYYYIDKDDHGGHGYDHSYDDHYESDSYEWKNIKKRDVSYEQMSNFSSKPILTTNIKVTSEYAGPTNPVTAAAVISSSSETTPIGEPQSASSENSGYDYDIMGFAYYDDTSRDEEDDNDRSTSYEDSEYYSDSVEYSNDKFESYQKKQQKTNKKVKSTTNDDYYDGDGIFSGVYGLFDSFLGYFGYGREPKREKTKSKPVRINEDHYYDDQARSTTPRNSRKRPTRAIESQEHRRPREPWYYPSYLFSSAESTNEVVVLPSPSPISPPPKTDTPWYSYLNPLGLFSMFKTRQPDTALSQESAETNWDRWESEATTKDPQMMIVEAIQNISSSLAPKKQYIEKSMLGDNKKDYDEYQVWRVLPQSQEQVDTLIEYKQNNEENNIKWWKGPSLRGHTDVVLPPGIIETFRDFLDYEDIKYEVTIFNLGKAIQHENTLSTVRDKYENRVNYGHAMTWKAYHRYSDMLEFMEYMQSKYPRTVELIHIGSSYEGMPLIVVKIGSQQLEMDNMMIMSRDNAKKMNESRLRKRKPTKNRRKRNAIFIEAGAHGQEWISPAAALWMIQKIVKTIESNDTHTDAFKSIDWYILPLLNPDSYEYTHTVDRLWRKNRSRRVKQEGLFSAALNWLSSNDEEKSEEKKTFCYGADLNRNWGDSWNVVGTSASPCSEYFAGDAAFSEPETKALSKFVNQHKKQIKIYLALHSYGQFISYPPSPSHSYIQDRYDDLFDMAMVSLETLRSTGIRNKYVIDTSSDMVYHRSGSSDSYAMNVLGIPYAYTIELRGTQGMILPSNQIESAAMEAFHLVRGMVGYV